ncbi:MAG: restriction endonuclease subunit S [Dialister sp.]|nr:restriction endonuclease subunit S [Dialister sp.]
MDKRFNAVDKKKQPQVDNYKYLLANDLFSLEVKGGDVFLLSTGEQTRWTTEELAGEYLKEGEVVTIPWGKSREVTDCIKYYKGKFVTADNRIATSNNTDILLNRYLYYFMMSNGKTIDSFYRGSGIKHPNMAKVLDMRIPVPPLPVQREIVRILDTFTELTARKKQYEYYRDQLLTFGMDVVWKTLGEVGRVSMCKRIMKNQTSPSGEVPFYKIGTFGKEADSFISRDLFERYKRQYSFPKKGDILISAAGTIGRTIVYDGEPAYFQDSNIVWIDNDESQVLNGFLKYWYQTAPWKVSAGGTISRLYNDNIERAKVPVLPLNVQKRLVNVLDHFDALCHDLGIGLPAEIEARRKQYEFYRDQLLTFVTTGDSLLTGQDRTGQDRTGQDRTGQDRTGQRSPESD